MAGPKGAKANLKLIEGDGAKSTIQIQVGQNIVWTTDLLMLSNADLNYSSTADDERKVFIVRENSRSADQQITVHDKRKVDDKVDGSNEPGIQSICFSQR